ncbi:MAG: GNAT family N-acetyltransferase [Acidobacteria bacterium]|nr:GNAT family N-acetyltransferase [Acidobacteriota bacterium]
MKKGLQIRFARKSDLVEIVRLCAEHSEFELASYDPAGKEEKLAAALFCRIPSLNCLLAEFDGEAVGFATFMKQFSTWNAQNYLYIDCLYVCESQRCNGIGEKLIRRIIDRSRKLECDRIEWQTPSFNTRAMKFYRRIGAASKSKMRFFLDISAATEEENKNDRSF